MSEKALTVKDMPMEKFMEAIFTVFDNWIIPGGVEHHHNVSATVSYENWGDVVELLWANRDRVNAISFLPRMADKSILYMPREEILDEDEIKWDMLLRKYVKVDYTRLVEEEDGTVQPFGCDGDSCEVVGVSAAANGSYLTLPQENKYHEDTVKITTVGGVELEVCKYDSRRAH